MSILRKAFCSDIQFTITLIRETMSSDTPEESVKFREKRLHSENERLICLQKFQNEYPMPFV